MQRVDPRGSGSLPLRQTVGTVATAVKPTDGIPTRPWTGDGNPDPTTCDDLGANPGWVDGGSGRGVLFHGFALCDLGQLVQAGGHVLVEIGAKVADSEKHQ
jgi:hypothetical protein